MLEVIVYDEGTEGSEERMFLPIHRRVAIIVKIQIIMAIIPATSPAAFSTMKYTKSEEPFQKE